MDQVLQLVKKLTYHTWEEGDTVFKFGDWGDTFYIILEGEVRVWVPYQEHENEHLVDHEEDEETGAILTREIGTRCAGQSFGELALIFQSPRTATVQALTTCHFAVL